jgi:hypothetical protein
VPALPAGAGDVEVKIYVIARHSAILPHYLYAWDAWTPEPHKTAHWLTRKSIAKRFTADQARRIVRIINTNLAPDMGVLCGAYVERVS